MKFLCKEPQLFSIFPRLFLYVSFHPCNMSKLYSDSVTRHSTARRQQRWEIQKKGWGCFPRLACHAAPDTVSQETYAWTVSQRFWQFMKSSKPNSRQNRSAETFDGHLNWLTKKTFMICISRMYHERHPWTMIKLNVVGRVEKVLGSSTCSHLTFKAYYANILLTFLKS